MQVCFKHLTFDYKDELWQIYNNLRLQLYFFFSVNENMLEYGDEPLRQDSPQSYR